MAGIGWREKALHLGQETEEERLKLKGSLILALQLILGLAEK